VFPAGRAKPKGKRSTEEDFKAAMSFLQGVSSNFQLRRICEKFYGRGKSPKPKKREHWTYLKKLINWLPSKNT